MTKYELVANEIQRQLDNDMITLEEANILNDRAYEKYAAVTESSEMDDETVTPEEYLEAIESTLGIDSDDTAVTPEEYLEALESVHGIGDYAADNDEATEADINEVKLAAYEACEAGEITVEDRNEILDYLDD